MLKKYKMYFLILALQSILAAQIFAQIDEFKLSSDEGRRQTNTEKPEDARFTFFNRDYELKFETKSRYFTKELKVNKNPEPKQKSFNDETEPINYKHKRGEKHIGFGVEISPFRPTYLAGESEYYRNGRKLGMLSLSWGRVIGTAKNVTFDYEIKVIPIAIAHRNEVKNPNYENEITTPNQPRIIRKTSYGAGISPIGFRFLFRPKKRLKPFFAAHAGILIFKDRFPVTNARHFNFTGDFGVGLQYQIKRSKAINIGYKYFHISNMNFGDRNPGYNASVFYIGYSFFYK